MAAGPVSFREGAGAGYVQGLGRLLKRLGRIPPEVRTDVRATLENEASALVDDIKAVAPVAPEFERHPGEMRDSTHKQPGRHELAVQVVVDAKDEKGREYPPHVEYGHKTKAGGHVAAEPFFHPSVRRRKPKTRKAVSQATSRGILKAWS